MRVASQAAATTVGAVILIEKRRLPENLVVFGTSIRLAQFPRPLKAHLKAYPNTQEIETLGATLIATDFPGAKIRDFISRVRTWGGDPGIAGRVPKRNNLPTTSAAFGAAVQFLDMQPPQLASALAELNAVTHLGTPAFVSSHLRSLRHALCPVFDSLLHDALPYSFDARGFAAFAQDCQRIADALKDAGVTNPRQRADGNWFVADVEGAVYAQAVCLLGGSTLASRSAAQKYASASTSA